MYELLLKDADLEPNDLNNAPHAPINLQLAQKHYHSRFLELRELILAEELKFKTVLKEIEEIKLGLRDKEIQAKITGENPSKRLKENTPFDEGLGDSVLSHVTESAESLNSPPQTTAEVIPQSPPSEDLHPEKAASINDTLEESQDISTVETNSLPTEQPPVEEAAVPEIIEPLPLPVPEEVHDAIVPVTSTETTISQSGESKGPSSSSTTHIDDNAGKNAQTENVQLAVEDITMDEENDVKIGVVLNQRQEEEEEEKAKSKEEEEESKDGDHRTEGEGKEAKPPENQEIDFMAGEEESREEATESVTEDNNQERHNPPQGQDEQVDADHEQDDQASLANNTELGVETESEIAATPAPDIAASPRLLNPAEAVDDEHTSGDEPVVFTRRSSRHRKSSATSLPPPPTRKRLRSRGRISELEPQLAVDSENDSEMRDDYPPADDDLISSPFDGSLTRRRDAKRKASFVESAESPPDKKRLREDSEPAEEEDPGPSSHNTRTRATRHTMRTEEQVALKRFQNVIGMLHSQISQHRNGNIFHNPIKNSEAPDYREIVKRPMDLKTIKTRVKDGLVANSLEFQRDIFLMFANAMMYNRPGSDVHAMAEDMMLESEGQILTFRQTEGLVKRGQRP